MILATDILIKSMIETAFADIRKNPWTLDDILSGLANDPFSSLEHGYKEVHAAKDWFLNNDIPVYLGFRTDSPTLPCISVIQMSSQEALDRASLADEGMEEEIDPESIDRPIQKVIPDFTPNAYDPATGILTLPEPYSTDYIAVGMYVVAKNSKTFIIKKLLSGRSVEIEQNIKTNLTDCYIAPAFALWNLHRELTYFHETYSIGVHTQSETATNIWLRQIMTYVMLRYKEVLLEGRGFEISTFQIGAMYLNEAFGLDRVFTTSFTLTGTVQSDWIKFVAPKLAKVGARIRVAKVVASPKDLEIIMTPEQYKAIVKEQTWCMKDDVFNADFDYSES